MKEPLYEWVLFDADDTLFHFDDFSGLKALFAQYGSDFSEADHQAYKAVNEPLWIEYQNGTMTSDEVQVNRFTMLGERWGVPAKTLNSQFLDLMLTICKPIEGAVHLLDSLRGYHIRMGIITNGFAQMQHARIAEAGLHDHFELLVISEQVGVAKPHQGIFDHAIEVMGNPVRTSVLMVGDRLSSDIVGGNNAGLDTCWFNPERQPNDTDIVPTYEVAAHAELEALLLAHVR